jgi:hypothetical protein
MFDEEKYISEFHGMELDPIAEPDKRFCENGVLFLVVWMILKKIAGKLTKSDIVQFQIIVENITTYRSPTEKVKGLYDRGAKESLNPDKTQINAISHDNLTTISCMSKILEDEGLTYHVDIKNHGKANFWRFDNVYPDRPRWARVMLPRDVIMWSYNGGSFWARFAILDTILESIISCSDTYDYTPQLYQRIWTFITTGKYPDYTKQPSTSGKQLAFIRLYCLRNTFLGKIGYKICTRLISKKWEESWKFVFNYYYKNQEHPINLLAKEIYEKNKEIF